MKKSFKAVLATIALTVAFATPVFATEQNLDAEVNYITNHVQEVSKQVESLLATDNACTDKATQTAQAMTVVKQLTSWVGAEESNYITYLQKVVVNKQETERIKKQNVAALTDLVKTNPGFQSQLDAAVAEYNTAAADTQAAQAAIAAAQQRFTSVNTTLNATTLAAMAFGNK